MHKRDIHTYEAAIVAGQLFLVDGLYWIFTAITKPSLSTWRLSLGGVFLSLAVGSRATLVFAVIFWL
jgi:hypothetical protein